MEFQVAFHVQEENESGAQEWLRRAKAVLDAHRDELVSPKRMIPKADGTNANVGEYCPGHVMVSQNSQPENRGPAAVLQMGPRE